MAIRSSLRRGASYAAGLVLAATAALAMPAAAHAATTTSIAWAPAASAAIHPGIQVFTDGAQCTANFVFTDGAGNVYLGQAAHCSGTGGSTETDGCKSGSLAVGTPVKLGDSGVSGTMVYNSWLTMQTKHEANADTCAYNDLALIKIPADAISKVNPSIPFWGGPTGLDTNGTAQLDTVLSYGNSELRGGITQLSPKQGKSLGDEGNGWSHNVYTVTPGVPGDSGSAFINDKGQALGILSTLQIAPLVGANGVGDLAKELAYAQSSSGIAGLQLALGTEKFTGPLLPI